ncbi:CHAT domain-containing protein [Parafilimonas terrae]|nr:CHAT domain-containing tetratricopeptide repeat protein [Parafilimonas terrae]
MRILLFSLAFSCILSFNVSAQCLTKGEIQSKASQIEEDEKLNDAKKLEQFYLLKQLWDKCKIQPDSVYSNILLKIGYYEVRINRDFDIGINFTKASLKINTSNKPGSSKLLAAKGYFSLAAYYYRMLLYDKALKYFDSTISIINTFPNNTNYTIQCKLYMAYIYFQNGDYQKAVEESTSGLYSCVNKKDSTRFLELLTQRSQSLYYENKLDKSLEDANLMISIAQKNKSVYELASALKIKARIFQKIGNFNVTDSLFKEVIKARIKTKDFEQIAADYNDYANFYLDSLNDHSNAKRYYLESLAYGKRAEDSFALARATINIGEIYLEQGNYKEALKNSTKALSLLNIPVKQNNIQPPTAQKLDIISAKELALVIMRNRMEALLQLFSKTKKQEYLSASVKTAFVTDTFLTNMRHVQTGNQSKLFWRDKTKGFYSNAIKAGFLANNADAAFYFMEKSRAVLLNDKLNELNAASYLSKADAAKQEDYEIRIIELQQKMSALSDTSKKHEALQLQLLNIKNDYEQFIKSLEQKYPVYYQYKYADNVPTLEAIQSYLAKNNQSFVHYFFADTATYILAITANKTRFIKLSQQEFNKNDLTNFLQLCSDKKALNNNYQSFALLSNSIYKKIFQPLQLPGGRVVICTENTVIPFGALCTDINGKHFLLNDYSFSYAYSACFLMKQFNNPPAKGNFIGFAPVSFNKSLGVVDLKNAANALNTSASFYNNDKLFTHTSASRHNFFSYAPSYSVVSIFSHAYADTTDNEPVLFMQDSLIHLSELQTLNNPATKLVLLSACQTNVGKKATGEGIYSLARGFASAGIPSVSATLWKADEQTIYAISEKLNQYLSEGMTKDEALRKAKLDFIQANSSEKTLPYYWANMILIGNADAIQLQTNRSGVYLWLAAALLFILISGAFIIKKKALNNL